MSQWQCAKMKNAAVEMKKVYGNCFKTTMKKEMWLNYYNMIFQFKKEIMIMNDLHNWYYIGTNQHLDRRKNKFGTTLKLL